MIFIKKAENKEEALKTIKYSAILFSLVVFLLYHSPLGFIGLIFLISKNRFVGILVFVSCFLYIGINGYLIFLMISNILVMNPAPVILCAIAIITTFITWRGVQAAFYLNKINHQEITSTKKKAT